MLVIDCNTIYQDSSCQIIYSFDLLAKQVITLVTVAYSFTLCGEQ